MTELELKNLRGFLVLILSVLPFCPCFGQMASVSFNSVDLAGLGTLNARASVALSRHVSLESEVRYNPWTFHKDGHLLQNKLRMASIGARWWLWNVYSGLWTGFDGLIEEYNKGGIASLETEEGAARAFSLSAGYSLMLNRSLDLDLGAGLWTGTKTYKTYSCPTCGRLEGSGTTSFILPADFRAALLFTF